VTKMSTLYKVEVKTPCRPWFAQIEDHTWGLRPLMFF